MTWANRAGGNLVPLVISVATISNNCSMNWVQRSLWERLKIVNYGVITVPSSKSIPRGPYRKETKERILSTLPTHFEPSLGLLGNNFLLEKFVLRLKYIISHNFHSSVCFASYNHTEFIYWCCYMTYHQMQWMFLDWLLVLTSQWQNTHFGKSGIFTLRRILNDIMNYQ